MIGFGQVLGLVRSKLHPRGFMALSSQYEIDDFFSRLHALIFGVFHVLLVILAMIALLVLAWNHIPALETPASERLPYPAFRNTDSPAPRSPVN